MDVYVAVRYVEKPSFPARVNLGKLQGHTTKFINWMVGVTSGHTLKFFYAPKPCPDSNIENSVNRKRKGAIPQNDFANAFFTIWVGPHPPNEDLNLVY